MNIEYKESEKKVLIIHYWKDKEKECRELLRTESVCPPELLRWNPKLRGDGVRSEAFKKGCSQEPQEGLVSL